MKIVLPKTKNTSANAFKTDVVPKQPMDDDNTEPAIHETFEAAVKKPARWLIFETIQVELAHTTNLEAMFDLSFKCSVCDTGEVWYIRGVGKTDEKTMEALLDEFVKRHMLCGAVNVVASDIVREIRGVQLPGSDEVVLPDSDEDDEDLDEEEDECSFTN